MSRQQRCWEGNVGKANDGEAGECIYPLSERRRKVFFRRCYSWLEIHVASSGASCPGEKDTLEDSLGQVQLVLLVASGSVFSPGLHQCFPAAQASPSAGSRSDGLRISMSCWIICW